jgi:hypothetical protein
MAPPIRIVKNGPSYSFYFSSFRLGFGFVGFEGVVEDGRSGTRRPPTPSI